MSEAIAHTIFPDLAPNEAVARYWELMRSEEGEGRLAAWEAQGEVDPALQDLRKSLLPALLDAESKYAQIERQWPTVFRRANSVMAYERFVEMRYTGLAQLMPGGGRPVFDNAAGERFVYQIEHNSIGLGVCLTPEVAADLSVVPRLAMGLANSFAHTAEILHANVFNVGFIYNPAIIGDGQPLFSEHHPIDEGEYSNVSYDLPLNEASLEHVFERMQAFRDQAGLLVKAKPVKLVVPVSLQFHAMRLLKGVAPDETPAYPREGVQVLDYLTDPKAWFVTTSIRGLASFSRARFRLDLKIEEGNLALAATERYGVGHYNPRAVFGVLPSRDQESRYAAATSQVSTQMSRMRGAAA